MQYPEDSAWPLRSLAWPREGLTSNAWSHAPGHVYGHARAPTTGSVEQTDRPGIGLTADWSDTLSAYAEQREAGGLTHYAFQQRVGDTLSQVWISRHRFSIQNSTQSGELQGFVVIDR